MKKIFIMIMTAALFVALAIPTFAATPSPISTLPDFPEDLVNYVLIQQNETHNNTYMLVQFDEPGVTPVYLFDGSKVEIKHKSNSSFDTPYVIYKLEKQNDVNTWVRHSYGTFNHNGITIWYIDHIVASTVDISDSNGNVVFTADPSINQILTGQVPDLVVKPMMETLKILVPFGVGLMALLICLPILRKVFYQFQIR